QRAFDVDQVAAKHPGKTPKSEPEHFIEFAERIPEWCVVVGLIGSGQEIHIGEEAGLVQWRWAVERSPRPSEWTVHTPGQVSEVFRGLGVETKPALNLDAGLRHHQAEALHEFVAELLAGSPASSLRRRAEALAHDAFHLRITRSLDVAKTYLRDRYHDDPDARFGIVASSKDRDLVRFCVMNDFQATKRIRFGP